MNEQPTTSERPMVWGLGESGWARRPNPIPWTGGIDNEWPEALRAAGYENAIGLTLDEHGAAIIGLEVWYHGTNGTYLVDIGLHSRWELVVCDRLPDLLVVLGMIGPIAAAEPAALTFGVLQHAVPRAFHAMHGHDVNEPCQDCDPQRIAEQRASRQRRMQKERTK